MLDKIKNDERLLRCLDTLFRVLMSVMLLVAILVILRDKDDEARQPDLRLEAINVAARLKPTDCTYEALVVALHRGGEIYMDCAEPIFVIDTLVITKQVRLLATYEQPLVLSGRNVLQMVMRVDTGGSVYAENLHIIDSRRFGVYVGRSAVFTAFTCRFAGHGSETGDGAAVWNKNGSVFMDDCVFENNTSVDAAAAVVNWNDSAMEIHESIFRNNITQRGNGSAIYNFGAMLVWDTTFENNSAVPIVSADGSIIIEDSTIKQAADAAVIFNGVNSMMTLHYTTVENTMALALVNDGTLNVNHGSITGASGVSCFNRGTLHDSGRICGL